MFAVAPFLVVRAPYESTMGLVQKIFYYHAPLGHDDVPRGVRLRASRAAIYLFNGRAGRRPAIARRRPRSPCCSGLIVLITGPLWARKAWGVWWQWDARLTSSLLLWMIFVAYLLVRRYGGPGSDKLAAAVALFGMANVPFVYMSVNVWRTLHPKTSVVPTLQPGMRGSSGSAWRRSRCCYGLLFVVARPAREPAGGSRTRCTWSWTIDRSCRDAEENRCQAFGAVACARRAARVCRVA